MLPDFPELKMKIRRLYMSHVEDLRRGELGPFRDIKETPVHEGSGTTLEHKDGTISAVKPERLSSEFEMDLRKWGTPTGKTPDSILRKIASEIAEQQTQALFRGLKEVTEKSGNVIDYKGKEFSLDQILQMFEMVQTEFDSAGRNDNQMVILPPQLHDRMTVLMSDPLVRADFERRMAGIFERKYDEWRDREAGRTLVD